MAHRILGLDIGTRRVKVAVVDKSVRTNVLVAFDSEAIDAPFDSAAQERALERMLSRVRRPDDVVMAGLPASVALHRVLSFPFTDERALAEAAGFELETHIPVDLSTTIIDEVIVERRVDGCDALVVAVPRAQVKERIELLKRLGAEPRQIGLVAISMARMLGRIEAFAEGTSLLLDIGALGTEAVVVTGGQPRYVRSLSLGSEAVREAFTAQFDAESVPAGGDLLASHGLLLPPGMPPSSDGEATLSAATLQALGPWLREVRQTLAVWRKGGRAAPDRIVLTGGMSAMRGLHDTLEAALQIPVVPLRLDGLDVVTTAVDDVERLSDFGAAAIALAVEGAVASAGQTMDFRQGDLAFEGDYEFLRQRLPAIAVFLVVAMCLLAVRTTITYRSLVVEAAQQVSTLGALSKAVTNKKLSSFQKVKVELQRPVAIDIAAYYPDLSAIRVLEEITSILHKVTEPPEFKPAGGPASAAMPGVQLAQIVAPPPEMRGIPNLGGVPGSARIDLGNGVGAPPRPRLGRPAFGGGDAGSGDGDSTEGGGGVGGGVGGGAGGGAGGDEKAEFFGHKVELMSVDIDRIKASLRGDCDTQDALLAFQTSLEKHPCFHKVKSTSDRITFERHREWFRFNIGFEISCPKEEVKVKDVEADAESSDGEANGDEADKNAADEGQ